MLLGYYFAERVAETEGAHDDLAVFLKWEQLAAHVRYRINKDERFRGIERVKKAANEDNIIRLGTTPDCQILGNQRTYGLWGLYTGPARASGLVNGEPTRLTPAGRQLVAETYLPVFAAAGLRNGDQIVSLLRGTNTKLAATGRDRSLLKPLGKIWSDPLRGAGQSLLKEHLLYGIHPDRTKGRQASLATAVEESLNDCQWEWSPARIGHLAKKCRGQGSTGEETAHRLERIRATEELLAPAAFLYDLVLACGNQTLAAVAATARESWGAGLNTVPCLAIQAIEPELSEASGDRNAGQRWLQIAGFLSNGEYENAIRLLIDQNAFVMKSRDGAGAWVELAGNKLKVRYPITRFNELPSRGEIRSLWRHPYFLDALRSIALELRP